MVWPAATTGLTCLQQCCCVALMWQAVQLCQDAAASQPICMCLYTLCCNMMSAAQLLAELLLLLPHPLQ